MEQSQKVRVGATDVFRVYAGRTWTYPRPFIILMVSVVLVQISELAAPVYLRSFFNTLATTEPDAATMLHLYTLVAILAALWFASRFFTRTLYMGLMYLETSVIPDLYTTSFEYLIRHSHTFFTSRFAGSLTHHVNKFARSYEVFVDAIVLEFFPTALFVVGSIIILTLHNLVLGVALAVWALLFVVFQMYVAKRRRPIRIAAAEADTKVTATLADAISNHSSIALFSAPVFEASRLRDVVDSWRSATLRIWKIDQSIWSGIEFLFIVVQVGLLFGATVYWGRGELTIGDFVLIQAYLLATFARLVSINRTLRRFHDAIADAEEMITDLKLPHSVADMPDAPSLHVSNGSISFNSVEFYFHETKPILHEFNLAITGGQKVALVGLSGAGKSTVTKILLRLFDVMSGKIMIDGQDISRVTQESLREQIAFVPQEPVLFHRTLMENIRYGRKNATDEEVFYAAKKAHCHEFISELPDGYDTYVGERGVKLSGGERQRVAVARAILKDAPILVLDEATSSLDSESEALIQDALDTLMRGKTVLAIAHRLSTIMKMDRILVMENGSIVDDGTHAELLKNDGLYQKLWSIQAGGFLQDEEE